MRTLFSATSSRPPRLATRPLASAASASSASVRYSATWVGMGGRVRLRVPEPETPTRILTP